MILRPAAPVRRGERPTLDLVVGADVVGGLDELEGAIAVDVQPQFLEPGRVRRGRVAGERQAREQREEG